MNKTSFTELPIDVKTLLVALYQTYCCNKKDDYQLDRMTFISTYENALKKNVTGGMIEKFLSQLKTIFQADGDSQHQLLMTQFIKSALPLPERDIFKAHLAALSNRIISKQMKEVIYKDLQ